MGQLSKTKKTRSHVISNDLQDYSRFYKYRSTKPYRAKATTFRNPKAEAFSAVGLDVKEPNALEAEKPISWRAHRASDSTITNHQSGCSKDKCHWKQAAVNESCKLPDIHGLSSFPDETSRPFSCTCQNGGSIKEYTYALGKCGKTEILPTIPENSSRCGSSFASSVITLPSPIGRDQTPSPQPFDSLYNEYNSIRFTDSQWSTNNLIMFINDVPYRPTSREPHRTTAVEIMQCVRRQSQPNYTLNHAISQARSNSTLPPLKLLHTQLLKPISVKSANVQLPRSLGDSNNQMKDEKQPKNSGQEERAFQERSVWSKTEVSPQKIVQYNLKQDEQSSKECSVKNKTEVPLRKIVQYNLKQDEQSFKECSVKNKTEVPLRKIVQNNLKLDDQSSKECSVKTKTEVPLRKIVQNNLKQDEQSSKECSVKKKTEVPLRKIGSKMKRQTCNKCEAEWFMKEITRRCIEQKLVKREENIAKNKQNLTKFQLPSLKKNSKTIIQREKTHDEYSALAPWAEPRVRASESNSGWGQLERHTNFDEHVFQDDDGEFEYVSHKHRSVDNQVHQVRSDLEQHVLHTRSGNERYKDKVYFPPLSKSKSVGKTAKRKKKVSSIKKKNHLVKLQSMKVS